MGGFTKGQMRLTRPSIEMEFRLLHVLSEIRISLYANLDNLPGKCVSLVLHDLCMQHILSDHSEPALDRPCYVMDLIATASWLSAPLMRLSGHKANPRQCP